MFLQSGSPTISIFSLLVVCFVDLATAGIDELGRSTGGVTTALSVEETPVLEINASQKPDGIEAGSTPSLICRLAVPGRVWWSSRGENLTTISDSEQQGRLDLKKASRNDTGNYTCYARTLDGRNLEQSVYVRVIEPGKVLGGDSVRAKVKTAVNLTCDVHGYPLSNFSWAKANDTENDHRLLERTIVRWMNETHARMNLSFESLSRKDNGTYTCRARDYNGPVTAHRHLFVTDVPQVSIDFIKAVGARRVFLNWTVSDGNEPIHSYFIKHMKNGTDQYHYGSELIGGGNTSYVLDGFESGTAYTFGISADNSVGRSHEQYDPRWITTLEKDPIFVPNVSFNGNSETSINLRWQKPPAELKEHVHYYKLMAIGADQTREAIYLNTEFPSYAFTGLKPATTYVFKIAACSDYTKQCGNWSTEINATTLDGVASPPLNLTVTCRFDDISGTSFASISWAKPARPNGEITRYDVDVNGTAIFKNDMGRLDMDKWGPHRTLTPRNNTRIDKIPANTNYTVHVFGRTRLRAAGQVAAANCTSPVTIPDKESLNLRTWRKIEHQGRQLFKLYLPRISERNGPICCYKIYLVKLPTHKTIADLPPPAESDVYTYHYVHNSAHGGTYLAEMFDSEKLIPEIFLGDGETVNGGSADCDRCFGLRPKAFPPHSVLHFVPRAHPTSSPNPPNPPTSSPSATPTKTIAALLPMAPTATRTTTPAFNLPPSTTTAAPTTPSSITTAATTTTTTTTSTSTSTIRGMTMPTIVTAASNVSEAATATTTTTTATPTTTTTTSNAVEYNDLRQEARADGALRRRRDNGAAMSSSDESTETFMPYDGFLDPTSNYSAFIEVIVFGEKEGELLTAYSNYLSPLYGGLDPRNVVPERVTTLGIILQVAVALILIVIVLLIALCVLLRYTKRAEQGGEEVITLRNSFRHLCRSLRGRHQLVAASPPDMPPIPKNELLQAYLERHRDSDYGFQHEFELLPDRFADRTTRASESRENLYKNRYPDIKCYDQTRVRLTQMDGIFGSDYINANFVLGYKERKKFICAQGPMENTVCDYWRMIWEQHLELILMLTNLEEYSKTKCAKYWPDKEETKNFGDITVEHVRERAYSDYVVRELKMTRIGERDERTIVQYHFLVWKDFMAPEHPHAILRFIKRVNEAYSLEKGPILVHCSAGVGRTGTLVALDSLLQQLAEEAQVSIFNTVCDLRHQRNFLVQSLKQYIFVYRALMEMAQYGDTEIAASQLKTTVERLRQRDNGKEKCRMEEEYDKISSVLEDRKSFSVGGAEENRSKNRSEVVIPYDRNRVILTPVPGREHSTYINASFIEGYDNSESFIITQDPLESTIADFWRMISEQCIPTIVMLSDLNDGPRKCPRYWPDDEANYEHIRVRYIQSESCPYFTRRELCVSNTKSDESVLVTQYQYHGWPTVEGEVPEVTRGLIELVDQTRQSNDSENTGSLAVHCSFGSDRSSMFVALSILVQQLRTEKRVDIFTTTKKLRSQRHGMISSFAQYEFLHRAIVNYSDLHNLAEDEAAP